MCEGFQLVFDKKESKVKIQMRGFYSEICMVQRAPIAGTSALRGTIVYGLTHSVGGKLYGSSWAIISIVRGQNSQILLI